VKYRKWRVDVLMLGVFVMRREEEEGRKRREEAAERAEGTALGFYTSRVW
jgi:hypothetical protein